MAVVKRGIVKTSAWTSFFNSFNSPLITPYSESSYNRCVNIGSIYDVKLQTNGGNGILLKNGTQVYSNSGYAGGGDTTGNDIIVAVSDGFVYFILYGTTASSYSYRSILVVYDTVNNVVIHGGRGSDSLNTVNTLALSDPNEDSCIYSPLLNYSVEVGYLDYTPQTVFKNGLSTSAITSNFLACSTVAFATHQPSYVTFGGTTYYVAGANILIPIDAN